MSTAETEITREEARDRGKILVGRIIDRPKRFPKPTGLDVYKPRETDIVVSTFPKSGTTLTQQLTYQVVIATGGAGARDPDGLTFDDICEVAPLVDFGPDLGFIDYESNPRVFKSHVTPTLFHDTIQKHIVVIRNPTAYPASCLDFQFEAWCGEKEPVTNKMILEEVYHQFLAIRILGLGDGLGFPFDNDDVGHKNEGDEKKDDKLPVGAWFLHAKGWLEGMRSNTLFMFYEDIVKDLAGTARRVAAFMDREISEEGVKQVVERCDRTYMSNDPKFKCTLENKALGFGENAWKAKPKTRNGFKQFSPAPEELEQINMRFKQEFGVDSYEEFKEIVYRKQKEFGFCKN